jgi:DNA repair protein RadC
MQRYWFVNSNNIGFMKDLNKNSTTIKNWAIDDRPREKLQYKGKEALSNAELLAILINNGSKEKSALALAQEILQLCSNNLAQLHKLGIKDFSKIKGIGPAKAITIMAALELGKRRHLEDALDKVKITKSKELAAYLKTILQNESKEYFVVVFLNAASKVLGYEKISEGGINGTVADPRIIFKKALENGASSIVLCHNHPSGNLQPSKADIELTKKMIEAGKFLDIIVADHIIVSETGYYSFVDGGDM